MRRCLGLLQWRPVCPYPAWRHIPTSSETTLGWGLALFVGTVRDHDEGNAVTALGYNAYPHAEVQLREVAERVVRNHPVVALAAVHRVGQLAVADPAVVVAVEAYDRFPRRPLGVRRRRWPNATVLSLLLNRLLLADGEPVHRGRRRLSRMSADLVAQRIRPSSAKITSGCQL